MNTRVTRMRRRRAQGLTPLDLGDNGKLWIPEEKHEEARRFILSLMESDDDT